MDVKRGKTTALIEYLNVRSGFSVSRFAIVTKLALRLSQFFGGRKLKNGATCIAVVAAVSCAPIIGASAEGRPLSHASVRDQSVAVILAHAQRGDPRAEARLGLLYSTGRGLPQNFAEAAKWFYRAATHGNTDAQYESGWPTKKGRAPRDHVFIYGYICLRPRRLALTVNTRRHCAMRSPAR